MDDITVVVMVDTIVMFFRLFIEICSQVTFSMPLMEVALKHSGSPILDLLSRYELKMGSL